jgi:catechol 2,3-dioxygenase-like lactoylglutathione lyase family enzyme
MIDHVSVRVQDFPKLVSFYREALAPLGYKVMMEFEGAAGLGSTMPDLWLMQTDKTLNPTHVALSGTREGIDAFHAAAIAAGGVDNGAPGLRADYHPHYYAAYVYDPEGNNIEVVCHVDPTAVKASAAKKPARPAGKAKAKAKAKKPAAKKPSKKAAKTSSKKPSKKRR